VIEVVDKIAEQMPLLLNRSEAGPTTFTKDSRGFMESLATFLG
jgi:hypothetical protein